METQTFILDAINRLTDLNLKSNLLLKCVNSVCFFKYARLFVPNAMSFSQILLKCPNKVTTACIYFCLQAE